MAPLFETFGRAAIVLGLALLVMPLLRRQSASARRLVLSVAFGFVLVGPFLPAWHVNAPLYHELVGRVVVEPTAGGLAGKTLPGGSPALARSTDWLALVWSVGALVVVARLAIGLVVARRLVRRAVAAPLWDSVIARAERETGRRIDVRASGEIEAPAVAGLVSPVVIVPASSASWTEERKRSVLLHELAHVAAHDLGVQVLATLACSLHWFNPLAWLASRRLRLERELAADEAVLRSGVRASTYAADLLAIAGSSAIGTVAIGAKPLPTRINAILAERRPAILGRAGAAVVVIGTAAVATGVACTTTSESTHATTAKNPVGPPRAVHGELEAMVEGELARAVDEWRATGGTILVMSPKGEVLAEAGGHSDRLYVTGSTIKPFLLAAALDEGLVTESDVFDCSRGERGGRILHDASPLGRTPLPEVVARSSNVGFAQIFDRLGGARTDHVLRRFHFTTPPELARAPAGDWKGAVTAIGATMTATPRQMTRAYAALANGGDGIVKETTAKRVTALLEGVVSSEHGTGRNAHVESARVAGKTGTSEWTDDDGSRTTYASFVGYFPAEQPRYVIFVGVESPSRDEAWGGNVAAPVFARIAARALQQ